ncbi:MAG: FeoA family protein [Nitrospirota bacterium]
MIPLGLLGVEERAEVVEVRGETSRVSVPEAESAQRSCHDRIEDMGVRVGKIVEVLSNGGRGPLLLKVDESRIAMGRGIAMKILVRRSEK